MINCIYLGQMKLADKPLGILEFLLCVKNHINSDLHKTNTNMFYVINSKIKDNTP